MLKKRWVLTLATGLVVSSLFATASVSRAAEPRLNQQRSSSAPVMFAAADARMRYYNGRWWYYHPDNTWSVWNNGGWVRGNVDGRFLDSNGRTVLDLPLPRIDGRLDGRVDTYYRGPDRNYNYYRGNNYRYRNYGRPYGGRGGGGINLRLF